MTKIDWRTFFFLLVSGKTTGTYLRNQPLSGESRDENEVAL